MRFCRRQHLRPSLARSMRPNVECSVTGLTRHGTMCKIAFWEMREQVAEKLDLKRT